MNYSDVILSICDSMNCKIYLELGCQYGNTTRKLIGVNRKVIGVDIVKQLPNTDFFEFYKEKTDDFFKHFNKKVDAVFIDANHSFKNVKKDLLNSLNILKKGGIIFIHDTDPCEENLLKPERCGDSYKIVNWVKENRKDLDIIALPIDEPGLSIIMRSNDRRVMDY